MKPNLSTKRLAISKANAQMVGIVAGAAFVTVFCLIASKAVFSTNQYQGKLTKEKEKAHQQLQTNLNAFNSLVKSYNGFDNKDTNIIGGSKSGTGDNDGSNSKIILDSLPSSYDFPALTSSLEKILNDRHLTIGGITGSDDISQQANLLSPTPIATPIPFTVSISSANYSSVQDLVKALQNSIRPIQIDSMDLSGGANDMTATISAHTYYQPAKSVNISEKEVK
jgi:hypothetical protein